MLFILQISILFRSKICYYIDNKVFDNIICLPGQPGDVLSPVPSLAEGGDYYEYIRGIYGDLDCVAADRSNSESEK